MKKHNSNSTGTSSNSNNITDLISKNLEQLYDENLKDDTIFTGFPYFDKLSNGFKAGELVIIGGRPAMGKTQFLINLAINISETLPLLYFTLDLSEWFITNRFISTASSIPIRNILEKELSSEQKSNLAQVENQFKNCKLFINDKCSYSLSKFKLYCQREINEKGIKVVIVDDLQMFSIKDKTAEKENEISLISQQLKEIAEQYNICVIASSQLNRALENRRGIKYPILTDLPNFESILPYADKVIFIYRNEYYGILVDDEGNDTIGIVDILLSKNKNGEIGVIKFCSERRSTSYRECENGQI